MTLLGSKLPADADIWALFSRGVADRRSPFRTPAVATVGSERIPTARTVVLRAADRARRSLTLHSDTRAEKVRHLEEEAVLAWHFWSPRKRLQIRAVGPATIARSGPEVEAAWAALSGHQRRTYAASPAPGSALALAGDGLPDLESAEEGRANFCVITCVLERLDILELARTGHRRCVLTWSADAWASQWVVP